MEESFSADASKRKRRQSRTGEHTLSSRFRLLIWVGVASFEKNRLELLRRSAERAGEVTASGSELEMPDELVRLEPPFTCCDACSADSEVMNCDMADLTMPTASCSSCTISRSF